MARRATRAPFVLAAFGATLALTLHQIFDLLVFYPKVGGMWWIVLGAGVATLGTVAAPTPGRPAPARTLRKAGTGALGPRASR